MSHHSVEARGPYIDELSVGDVFDSAPPVTLSRALATTHHAIVGNRLALTLDETLSQAVTGAAGQISPAVVWDVSIGQSTLVTHQVKANLFYRNLSFHRLPRIGDTLRTVTTVDALRGNRKRPGRPRTGMAALHIRTSDHEGRTVLDYWRCAMLPASPDYVGDLPQDDLERVGANAVPPGDVTTGWDLQVFADLVGGPRHTDLVTGMQWRVTGGDVVSSAPELARLTGNLAMVHHDAEHAGGRRLVYGGHTIALALHQLTRALPSLVTVAGWRSCDHLAPVHEADTVTSTIEVEAIHPRADGGAMVDLRVISSVTGGETGRPVLDWRLTAVLP